MLVAQNHWVKQLLSGGRTFGCGFLAVALVEPIHASRGVDQLLLTGKKRVASRADFDVQVAFFGRASLKGLAASAANGNFYVFRMNSWFHVVLSLEAASGRVFKQVMIEFVCKTVKLTSGNTDFRNKMITVARIKIACYNPPRRSKLSLISSNTVCLFQCDRPTRLRLL